MGEGCGRMDRRVDSFFKDYDQDMRSLCRYIRARSMKVKANTNKNDHVGICKLCISYKIVRSPCYCCMA